MRDDHAADAPHGDGTPRRRFLKQGSALLAAGIAIGFRMPDAAAAGKRASGDPHPAAGEFEPNAWVRVLPDDTIKLVVHKHDSGTGTRTALAAVVAEARRRSVPGRRDHAGRSVLRGLPASAVESVLDRRQHECRDGVRPAASSGRDRACDARRSGGASMGRARFCVHDGRRRRAACVERPPGDVRRARAGGRAVAGAEAGRAERSRAVPLHRQAAQEARRRAEGRRLVSVQHRRVAAGDAGRGRHACAGDRRPRAQRRCEGGARDSRRARRAADSAAPRRARRQPGRRRGARGRLLVRASRAGRADDRMGGQPVRNLRQQHARRAPVPRGSTIRPRASCRRSPTAIRRRPMRPARARSRRRMRCRTRPRIRWSRSTSPCGHATAVSNTGAGCRCRRPRWKQRR